MAKHHSVNAADFDGMTMEQIFASAPRKRLVMVTNVYYNSTETTFKVLVDIGTEDERVFSGLTMATAVELYNDAA